MHRIAQWSLAAVGCTSLTFVSFNAGFDLGTDTGACVAFSLADETPVQENAFCQRAVGVTQFPARYVRAAWLKLNGEEWSRGNAKEQS